MIEIEANGTGSLDGDEKNVEWSNTETIDSNLPNPVRFQHSISRNAVLIRYD